MPGTVFGAGDTPEPAEKNPHPHVADILMREKFNRKGKKLDRKDTYREMIRVIKNTHTQPFIDHSFRSTCPLVPILQPMSLNVFH